VPARLFRVGTAILSSDAVVRFWGEFPLDAQVRGTGRRCYNPLPGLFVE
jgi:hypothetical protein